MHADKARNLTEKGRLGGEQQGKETQENRSATWLNISGFVVMGLAFWVLSGQSSCLCPFLVQFKVLTGSTSISQSR